MSKLKYVFNLTCGIFARKVCQIFCFLPITEYEILSKVITTFFQGFVIVQWVLFMCVDAGRIYLVARCLWLLLVPSLCKGFRTLHLSVCHLASLITDFLTFLGVELPPVQLAKKTVKTGLPPLIVQGENLCATNRSEIEYRLPICRYHVLQCKAPLQLLSEIAPI